jgi:hypothetical protein
MATKKAALHGKYIEDIKLDLAIIEEADALYHARSEIRFHNNHDTLEYMVLRQNLDDLKLKIKEESFPTRHAKNLQLFNAILYKHGVRQWAYSKTFIVHNESVHNDLEKYFFIYVPAWEASSSAGLPAACGNHNQRQLNRQVSDFFGVTHNRRYLEIHNAQGDFSSHVLTDVPFEIGHEMKSWMAR